MNLIRHLSQIRFAINRSIRLSNGKEGPHKWFAPLQRERPDACLIRHPFLIRNRSFFLQPLLRRYPVDSRFKILGKFNGLATWNFTV